MIFEKGITRYKFLPCGESMYQKSQDIQKNCAPEFSILPALKLPSCGLVVFIDMNTFILTDGRNFERHSYKTYIRYSPYFAADSMNTL